MRPWASTSFTEFMVKMLQPVTCCKIVSVTTTPHGLGPTRARVLALLQTAATPMTITQIAERLDLHQNSSRFHLEALVATGYATRHQVGTGGPGRPPMHYQATSESPEMHHVHLVELTQTLLGQLCLLSPDPGASAIEAGRTWGSSLASQEERDHELPETTVIDLVRHLGERGFTTTRDQAGLCFSRCPFRGTVQDDLLPLVCAVHQGFLDGFLEGTRVHSGLLEIGEQTCRVDLGIHEQG